MESNIHLQEGTNLCQETGSAAAWLDEKLKVGPFEMDHDADTLTIRVETTLNEDPTNESFGIDNVRLLLQMLGYEDRFERSEDGWVDQTGAAAQTSECGSFGTILGGYNIISGGGSYLEKTYDLAAMEHDQLTISFDFVKIDSWDNEAGQLLVDGTEVWSQIYGGGSLGGVAECGSDTAGWVEIKDHISLTISHTDDHVTLRFQTGLNSGPTDESFGVDNVKVLPVRTALSCGSGQKNVLCRQGYFDGFDDGIDDWFSNVALSTSSCDRLGQILGGAGILGGGSLVSKTFDLTPISHDALTVSMDFIKIDSWDNEDANIYIDASDPIPGLVLELRFDGSLEDSSDASQSVTLLQGTETYMAGRKGSNALRFDGNTIIQVANSASLQVESGFTQSVWIKIDMGATTEMNLAEKGSWIGDWLSHLKTDPEGNFYFAFAAGTFSPTNVDDDVQTLDRGRWIHVAMTWDGARRKLYIDGQLDGEDTPTGHLSPNDSPIEIGGQDSGCDVCGRDG